MKNRPDYQNLEVFRQIAEAGSLSAAGRKLHLPKATLSRRLKQLEESLGVQLFIRNTRKVQLTEVGRSVLQRAQSLSEQLLELQAEVSQKQQEPQGLLRLSAGVEFGLSILSPFVNQFLQKYPRLSIELDLTGRRVDLIEESFDLGLRIGPLEDSSLSSRKLAEFRYRLYAQPELARKSRLRKPEDLLEQACLGFSRAGKSHKWIFFQNSDRREIQISPRLISNNFQTLRQGAEAGLGFVFMPEFLARGAVNEGRLTHVLPDWRSETIPVHALYPAQKYLAPKSRAFLDELVLALKHSDWIF